MPKPPRCANGWWALRPARPGYIRVELVKRLFGVESRKEGVFDSQDCLARFHQLTNKLTDEFLHCDNALKCAGL